MAKKFLSVNIKVDGIQEVLRALDKLPIHVQEGIEDESKKLAQLLAGKIRADGMSDAAPQSPLVARTVQAKKGVTPTITIGGDQRLGRNKKPAYKLLFGSVFGSNAYEQFHRPHNGQVGYWIYPTIDREAGEIARAWNQVADDAIQKFRDE
jgi:hypothetical protein